MPDIRCVLVSLCFANAISLASPASPAPTSNQPDLLQPPQQPQTQVATELRGDLALQLGSLVKSYQRNQEELSQIAATIVTSGDEVLKQKLKDKKSKLIKQQRVIADNIEELATGGVKLSDYNRKEGAVKFDIQAELLEIFKPMIAELKDLTERPRAIEALRSERNQIEQDLPIAEESLAKIANLRQSTSDLILAARLDDLARDWQKQVSHLRQRQQVVNLKLEELLHPPGEKNKPLWEQGLKFFWGRGLTLLLAALAFFITFIALTVATRRIEQTITKKKEGKRKLFQRAIRLALQLATTLLSLVATMVVLYLRGDWLILGLILLALLGIGWGLSQSVPKYLTLVKLLLNMGSVREGERLVYGGIPWKVTNINMFTTLENPQLDGGILKLPVPVIVTLNTRPLGTNEVWFPTAVGDYVFVGEDLFGEVISQSPEMVQVRMMGGSIKTYSTASFLDANPRNLSKSGFGIFSLFGLDYAHRDAITSQIPNLFETRLLAAFAASEFASDLSSLKVEFAQAAASSVDLEVMAVFHGHAACRYFQLQRFIKKAAVDITITDQLTIPFNCLTVYHSPSA